MKKSIALILALVIAFAFTGMVFAQASAPTKAQANKATPQKKVALKTFKGAVVSVDAIANSMVVKGKKAEMTFQVDPAAKIVIAKKECKLADIKTGIKVTVTYKVEGDKNIATAIKG